MPADLECSPGWNLSRRGGPHRPTSRLPDQLEQEIEGGHERPRGLGSAEAVPGSAGPRSLLDGPRVGTQLLGIQLNDVPLHPRRGPRRPGEGRQLRASHSRGHRRGPPARSGAGSSQQLRGGTRQVAEGSTSPSPLRGARRSRHAGRYRGRHGTGASRHVVSRT